MGEPNDDYWRERARDEQGSDDVMVYEDATVDDSPDDGVWVTAYVWVARPDYDPCDDE